MEINIEQVKAITDHTDEFPIPYSASMTIDDLKKGIETILGFRRDWQVLSFEGRVLLRNDSMASYNIYQNSVLYFTHNRFMFNRDFFIELSLPITIDGVKSDKTYNFGTKNKLQEMTFEQFRAGIAELMNIKEEDYDFSDGDVEFTKESGEICILITEIALTKKKNYDSLPIEDKIIKNMRINGLWDFNLKNLSLINVTNNQWNSYVEKNKNLFISCFDEGFEINEDFNLIFFNMYIIHLFATKYKEKLPKFKWKLDRTKKTLNRKFPFYTYYSQKDFIEKFQLI